EGLTQSHCTITIVTLPRITPKSTSKITSPDYAHDFTDVAVGKSAELYHRRHRRENVENCVGKTGFSFISCFSISIEVRI
ncbi:TPA: hypothetical protein ACN33P_002488, partial [Vibrio parahaemolyticus]